MDYEIALAAFLPFLLLFLIVVFNVWKETKKN